MIIQNALCMPIYFSKDNYRITLDNERLRNLTVNGILGFSSEGDQSCRSPFNADLLASSQEMESLSIFLNLMDNKKNLIFKDMNLSNLISPPELPYYMEVFINKKIDFENSFISYKNNSHVDKSLILLYLFYQTRRFYKWDDLVNGSFTISVAISENEHRYKLSDFIDRTLAVMPIKRIITKMNFDDLNTGYLDIFGKNGERIEYLPLPFLNEYRSKKIFFDGIKIDFEKSYLITSAQYAEADPISITFIY